VDAVLDEVGGLLATESFEANPDGYSALLSWLAGFGAIGKVGVEGWSGLSGWWLLRRAYCPPRGRARPDAPAAIRSDHRYCDETGSLLGPDASVGVLPSGDGHELTRWQ
jgi:hypothetical protein